MIMVTRPFRLVESFGLRSFSLSLILHPTNRLFLIPAAIAITGIVVGIVVQVLNNPLG